MWVKYFSDKSTEIGSDTKVNRGLASWSKGRLESLYKVSISFNNITSTIETTQDIQFQWYQFDRYVTNTTIGETQPTRIGIAAQVLINKQCIDSECLIKLCYTKIKSRYYLYTLIQNKNKPFLKLPGEQCVYISKDMVGKWLSICILGDQCGVYLGRRGSLNGQQIFRQSSKDPPCCSSSPNSRTP